MGFNLGFKGLSVLDYNTVNYYSCKSTQMWLTYIHISFHKFKTL